MGAWHCWVLGDGRNEFRKTQAQVQSQVRGFLDNIDLCCVATSCVVRDARHSAHPAIGAVSQDMLNQYWEQLRIRWGKHLTSSRKAAVRQLLKFKRSIFR